MNDVKFTVFNEKREITACTTDRGYVYERFAQCLVAHREYKSPYYTKMYREIDYQSGGHTFTFYLDNGDKYVFEMDC